jgi:hypothetical protein
MQASISLGLLDLSPLRAAVVHKLNEAGIPVVAWLLLPVQEGLLVQFGQRPAGVGAL